MSTRRGKYNNPTHDYESLRHLCKKYPIEVQLGNLDKMFLSIPEQEKT